MSAEEDRSGERKVGLPNNISEGDALRYMNNLVLRQKAQGVYQVAWL